MPCRPGGSTPVRRKHEAHPGPGCNLFREVSPPLQAAANGPPPFARQLPVSTLLRAATRKRSRTRTVVWLPPWRQVAHHETLGSADELRLFFRGCHPHLLNPRPIAVESSKLYSNSLSWIDPFAEDLEPPPWPSVVPEVDDPRRRASEEVGHPACLAAEGAVRVPGCRFRPTRHRRAAVGSPPRRRRPSRLACPPDPPWSADPESRRRCVPAPPPAR